MGACKGAFPPCILQKQRCPLALQTMNCTPADHWLQKCVGQTTDRNRARLPSLFGMKFTQVPSQYSKGIGEVKATIEVWVHARVPSRCISRESSTTLWLFKQWTALLQTINCRKVWGKQPTGTEQGSPHCLVWNSHTSPRQEYSNWFAEHTMSPNNSVLFHLIMVQRNGEKQSWITSGNHTSIGIDWHSFGVLEADDYHQNNCFWFGNKLILVNYIYMYKKNLNNCIQIA
jgi:hypothetical protein